LRFAFPNVTVHFGEPLSYPVEAGACHERQLQAAGEIFARVREMYAGIDSGQASRQLNEA
jgi:hypothetical protein